VTDANGCTGATGLVVSLSGCIIESGMAAATCHATTKIVDPADRFVLAIMDVREQPANFSGGTAPSYTNLWSPATYHHPDWTHEKLGNIFGLTMDCDCNLYVTAISQAAVDGIAGFGTLGGFDPLNPSSAASVEAGGAIYKIDGTTGAPSLFAKLPQQLNAVQFNSVTGEYFYANGLGQIGYDGVHNQLFVSNREDGKIYRLSMAGATLSTFDPLNPDPGTAAPATNAEFVWALSINADGSRLYYSINRVDVRSVALTATGDFDVATDRAEFTVPNALSLSKISDLAFSQDGSQMLLSQRNQETATSFVNVYNHMSMAYLYDYDSGTGNYILNRTIQVGDDRESYGGTAFAPLNTDPVSGVVTGQDQMLWFSSADILDGAGPHGLEAVPVTELGNLASGNVSYNLSGSISMYTAHRDHIYVIDYDGDPDNDTKGTGGDID
ncbi:MAG: hypothetical protein KDK99_20300, partial [Verrucomicrobiales bacterium]|nr:hypothetical protein [Verrucomicrobiales bacterium]